MYVKALVLAISLTAAVPVTALTIEETELAASATGNQSQYTAIRPGTVWNDTEGKPINAHGGCIVYHKGTYYLFGEDRTKGFSNGVSCYTSKDLYNWTRIGLVLKTEGTPRKDLNDISKGRLFERPKVIYNARTKKWIMWSHWEINNGDYSAGRVCVATSNQITGPYKLYKTFRPNGHDTRDQTLFVDTDGKAYHFGSTDMNTNTLVSLLDKDYLNPSGKEAKILLGLKFEAASIFKVGDIYYGLFSGCTGWAPNPGKTAFTTDILGRWTPHGNFAVDQRRQTTYNSQSCYVFKIPGKENAYMYMGDRWNPSDVGNSRYIWLPVSMRSGYPVVRWYEEWTLSVYDKMYRYKRAAAIKDGQVYALLERQSDRLVSKSQNGFTIADDDDALNLNFRFEKTATPEVYRLKDVKTGNYLTNVSGTLLLSTSAGDVSQEWRLTPQQDGYYIVRSVKDKKFLSVSGDNTFNGTNLYLTDKGTIHYFGVYFDSNKYHYKTADIFKNTKKDK